MTEFAGSRAAADLMRFLAPETLGANTPRTRPEV